MKYRFGNEPADLDLAGVYRALAKLADEGKVVGVPHDHDEDLDIASVEFAGMVGTFYEMRWVRQLINHYQDDGP